MISLDLVLLWLDVTDDLFYPDNWLWLLILKVDHALFDQIRQDFVLLLCLMEDLALLLVFPEKHRNHLIELSHTLLLLLHDTTELLDLVKIFLVQPFKFTVIHLLAGVRLKSIVVLSRQQLIFVRDQLVNVARRRRLSARDLTTCIGLRFGETAALSIILNTLLPQELAKLMVVDVIWLSNCRSGAVDHFAVVS